MFEVFLALVFGTLPPSFPPTPLPTPVVCEAKNGHNPVWTECTNGSDVWFVKSENPNKK